MAQIRKGTRVGWNWGSGHAEGKVSEVFHEKVTQTIAGSEITRNGSDEQPAYLIEQEDGSRVLKLSTEVKRAD